MISKRLINAIKLSPKRAYRIAQECRIHPTTLSKLVCGIEKTKPGDPRVIAVGKVLGLKEAECFTETHEEEKMLSVDEESE